MNLQKSFKAVVVGMLFAAGLSAAVSPALYEWSKGPAQFLMTKEEAAAWKNLKSDSEAQAFIDLFWARRDPTPGTPVNESKQNFDTRVKFADEKFTSGRTRGSVTDRGKYLILLGVPSRALKANQESAIGRGSDVINADSSEGVLPSETWVYEGDKIPKFATPRKFDLVFVDQSRTGLYKIGRTATASATDLAQKAVQAFIVSPGMTQLPSYQTARVETRPAAVVTAAPAPAAAAAKTTAFSNPAFAATIADIKAGKTTTYKTASATYSEDVTPSGEYFVPVQIYVTRGSAVTPESSVTFFGTVEDAAGQVVAMFEEPAKLTSSKEDLFYDRSVVLPSGKYKGYFGLAVDGKPAMVTSKAMDLTSLDKDEPGATRLIISNNIYALPAAQKPTDPFAFGGIKVVPKGDKLFRKSDELWYFVELRNPGVTAEGKTSLQVKVDVEGMINKKKVTMSSPLQEQAAEPLKGVAQHFALGNSIPLAGFAPGDYTMKVKVIDTIKQKTYNFTETFKVASGS